MGKNSPPTAGSPTAPPTWPCSWRGSALWVLSGAEPRLPSPVCTTGRGHSPRRSNPFQSGTGGWEVSMAMSGAAWDWAGGLPWTRTQHPGRVAAGALLTTRAPPPKTSSKTSKGTLQPQTNQQLLRALPHPLPAPAPVPSTTSAPLPWVPRQSPQRGPVRPPPRPHTCSLSGVCPRSQSTVWGPHSGPARPPAPTKQDPRLPGWPPSGLHLTTDSALLGTPCPQQEVSRTRPGKGRHGIQMTCPQPSLIFCSFGSESFQTMYETDLNPNESK